jgi:hypothetical protein
MRITFRLLFVSFVALLSACGGGGGSDNNAAPEVNNTNNTNGQQSSVITSYNAMGGLCGPGMTIGVTTNRDGNELRIPNTPTDKPAANIDTNRDGEWSTLMLESAELGGAYNYYSVDNPSTSPEAGILCSTVLSLIYSTDVRTAYRAYSDILLYFSDYTTPTEPWDGNLSPVLTEADFEMRLNYTTGIPVDNGWNDVQEQYLSMRVSCEQPFKVQQIEKFYSFLQASNNNLNTDFCELKTDGYRCLALQGVFSGDSCTYVVESQAYTPVNSTNETIISFGGTLKLAPEADWPGRPAYQMTIDRFKLEQ